MSDRYTERINIAANDEKQKLERSRKVILKMYDHVNLAKRQYNELKESDDDFEMKFRKSFQSHQVELTREMSSQLVTLVGIFTAIAFVVFGGISSLDNVFQNGIADIPLLRVMIIGIVWSLCMINGKREKFSKILKGGGCSSPILFAFFTPASPRFGRVR